VRSLAGFIGALVVGGCAIPALTPLAPGATSPFTGYSSPIYRNDDMWLCRPDLPKSACRGDLTATELAADGSRKEVVHTPAAHPDVDCFYVYPTVDLGWFPGNHATFTNRDDETTAALTQAARFDEVCAVYAPLYRQITIGTYVWGDEQRERRLAVAFSDVHDAFLHYMGQYNHGRKVVLIGHSQGADMVIRLLQAEFDNDATMRDRLLVALPIGGSMHVPYGGSPTGGSLDKIPLCTRPDQLGCVIAYHSYRGTGAPLNDWAWDEPLGQKSACVNPAAIGQSGWHRFGASYFPTSALAHKDGIKTPFVLLRDLYWGACVEDRGRGYLVVAAGPGAGDVRHDPIDLEDWRLNSGLGFHVLDFQFALGDLIELVRVKAAIAGK
jgi:hypothetical protein